MKRAGLIKEDRSIILEIGVGTGEVIKFLNFKKFSPKYIGIDISREMLSKLKLKFNRDKLDLILADAYHLPFKDDVFDLALMIRSIHILSKWKRALIEAKRVLIKEKFLTIVTGGPGLKILNECPSNDKYIELREKFGNSIFYYGGDWEYIPNFIEEKLNGQLEVLQNSYIVLKNLSDAIHEFKNQLMTWHTQVPKKIHDKIVQELEEYLVNKYGTLDIKEKQTGYFTIAFVRFGD